MGPVTITAKNTACAMCGGPRESDQRYCRACFAAYARAHRASIAKQEGKRQWTNTQRDRTRCNGHHFVAPTWLAPKTVPQILATISASIVWGVCGKMADMPEY